MPDTAADGGTRDPCVPGDLPLWLCVQPGLVDAGPPNCGDFRLTPMCIEGSWTCTGLARDLIPDREHVCGCSWRYGARACECDPAGTVVCELECGPVRCRLGEQYCAVTPSDVGGEPPSYACAPFVEPCSGIGCDCVAPGATSCGGDGDAVHARYPGG